MDEDAPRPEGAPEARFAAFFSYSHADSKIGGWLHTQLESYRTPKPLVGATGVFGSVGKRIGAIFRDRVDLAATADLKAGIRKALGESEALLVLCSPRSAASPYVSEEIRAFKAMGRGGRIFAAIVAGEPHAAGKPGLTEADECFPKALLHTIAPDGQLTEHREPTEPVAADFRPGKDGRENALLKLVAGLLGLPLDDLARRHLEAERRRRLISTAIAGGMAVLAIVAAGAGVVALQQQQVAESQRKEAAEQRDRAENALAQVYVDAARAAGDAGNYDQALRFGVYALRLSALKSEPARLQVARAAWANQLVGRYGLSPGWDPAFIQNSDRHPESYMSFEFEALLTPDGNRIAGIATVDDTARLWDVGSGKLLASTKHEWSRENYAFQRVWLAAQGQVLATCQDPVVDSYGVGETPPLKFDVVPLKVATDADASCRARRQLASGQGVVGFPAREEIESTAYGALLAISGEHDAFFGKTLDAGQDWLDLRAFSAFAVAPNGRQAAAGLYNGLIALYAFSRDISNANADETISALESIRIIGRHSEQVQSLMFSADGAMLASAGMDGLARLWRIDKETTPPAAREAGAPFDPEVAHPGLVISRTESTDPEDYSSTWDVRIADVAGKELVHHAGPNARALAISSDGKLALITDGYIEGGDVHLIDLASGKTLASHSAPFGIASSGAFTPDGKAFAAGSEGAVFVWDVDPRRGLIASLSIAPVDSNSEGDSGLRSVTTVVFSPDGRLLASGSDAGVQLWQWSDDALLAETRTPVQGGVTFSSDSELRFATGGEPSMVTSWDISLLQQPGAKLLEFVCGAGSVASPFHPSLRAFSAIEARSDRMVQGIWQDASGQLRDVCNSPVGAAG